MTFVKINMRDIENLAEGEGENESWILIELVVHGFFCNRLICNFI
jgi:hypothetical protein